MLNQEVLESLNEQGNKQVYSAYFYLSMATYANSLSLSGCSNWFTIQGQEEMAFSLMLYDYINRNGGNVQLRAIDAPTKAYSSIDQAFAITLEHERAQSVRIKTCVEIAQKNDDKATEVFLQWFVQAQEGKENFVSSIIDKIGIVEDAAAGIFMIDRELAQRVFIPPTGNV